MSGKGYLRQKHAKQLKKIGHLLKQARLTRSLRKYRKNSCKFRAKVKSSV